MLQSVLWHETIFDALVTAVLAAGGYKRVAPTLWPTLDENMATTRLRSALNPEHQQKLDLTELLAIARLAKSAGDNSLMQFLGRDLGYEVKPLSAEESEEQAIVARELALLEELRQLAVRKRK